MWLQCAVTGATWPAHHSTSGPRALDLLTVADSNRVGHCCVVDLDAVLELYGLPPEQFTAARNALSKALRDVGDATGSASVKTLRKPTIAAWLANRLVRIASDEVAELTEFGDELRQAHQSADRERL